MNAIYVEILATKGSTPRDAGTAMKVTAQGSVGTIGGGALEYRAITKAREMLAGGFSETRHPAGSGTWSMLRRVGDAAFYPRRAPP
jgi:xanthine dehydrogenase accessory factor